MIAGGELRDRPESEAVPATVQKIGDLEENIAISKLQRRFDVEFGIAALAAIEEGTDAEASDASVIGIPDDRWGETVLAVVVLRAGHAASAEDLDRHCRGRLGGFKVPRRYEFVEKLPRNATGKVLKRELRQPYWEGRERAVG